MDFVVNLKKKPIGLSIDFIFKFLKAFKPNYYLGNQKYCGYTNRLIMNILAAFLISFGICFTTYGMPIPVAGNIKSIPIISSEGKVIDDHNLHTAESQPNHEEHHAEEGGHHTSMAPLFFIILAIILGAATRHFLQKSPLPFTVMLLIFGLIAGLLTRLGVFDIWNLGFIEIDASIVSRSIEWAANIDPHMLLYTFLPVLIFEAAFAMDVHTFKKSVTNAVILAVPGILVALCLTAAIMMGLQYLGFGLSLWNWSIALMFGAVISATDPVAVVALLKDLGASKKLGTLIEGESLLNDGTAIVLFMVFFTTLTGEASGNSPILEFFRVSFGGILVGGAVGYVSINWLRKVFNDALVEISVIVGAAFLTFFVAEHFFHVSGVLALVTMGLIMAGIGRTRISPEVGHFMHEFWDLAGFIANTLLFVIVGVVIAERSVFSLQDFIILGIIYIGIHIVRAIVIFMFYPIMKRVGYGLSQKDAYVVWYGALRGAIALALALIVAGVDDRFIPAEIKNQFLFYTAGIVALTLLINATTVKLLIGKLGLTKPTPEKLIMMKNAMEYLENSTERALEKIKKNRYTKQANFEKVAEYLHQQHLEIDEDEIDLGTNPSIFETRRRILEKEKSSYWSQFKEGMLGASAVNKLTEGINEIIDSGGMKSLSDRKDLEQEWKTPALLGKLQSMNFLRRFAQRFFFGRLAVSYDSAVGFVVAQEESLKLLESMILSAKDDKERKNLELIENEINENRIHGLTFLRNIRNSFPEIYTAVSTRQAIRSMLNSELHTVERLVSRGRINSGEAEKMIYSIEARMKKLNESPPALDIPRSLEQLRKIQWFKDLDEQTFEAVADLFQSRIFSVDQPLVRIDGKEEGLFVIIRGKVKVIIGSKVLDILGPGNVIGEMSIITDNPRCATVTAESPVTTLWLSYMNMQKAKKLLPDFEERLWEFAGSRFVENMLVDSDPYSGWAQEELRSWIGQGSIDKMNSGSNIELNGNLGILLEGKIWKNGDKKRLQKSPAILGEGDVIAEDHSRVFTSGKK